jgi:SAM-dependent methyltransferase
MAGDSSRGANRAKFDAYAPDYVEQHRRNIAMSGEPPEYFAIYKRRCIERLVGLGFDAPVLDYGCGVGMVTRELCGRFSEVHGFDPSLPSLDLARERCPSARFHATVEDVPDAHFGLCVISGVLHHTLASEREALVQSAIRKLRSDDSKLVVFEHNPFNPLTRWAVATCPFDDDAQLLGPWEARALLRRCGLAQVTLRFIVFLPGFLSALRWLEPHLGRVPLGAQVMLVGRGRGSKAR